MDLIDSTLELQPDQIRRQTNPATLGFATTEKLPPPDGLFGQPRAQEAMGFALAMEDDRYNLYVSGQPGSGRLTSVLKAVEVIAAQRAAPPDWCYVHNFERMGEPLALTLPTGSGHTFARDVDTFVATCRRDLKRAFSSDSYRMRHTAGLKEINAQYRQVLEGLARDALAHGFMLQSTPMGMTLIPMERVEHHGLIPNRSNGDGERSANLRPFTPEEFSQLPEQQQERIRTEHDLVQEEIMRATPRLQALQAEAHERMQQLDTDVARQVVSQCAEGLLSRYGGQSQVDGYIRHVQSDIVMHARLLGEQSVEEAAEPAGEKSEDTPVSSSGENSSESAPEPDVLVDEEMLMLDADDVRERFAVTSLLRRYRVNVLVAHGADEHAPIVREMNPTPWNLLGHAEFGVHDGLPYTDHLMIRAGALHRANGGYLILQVRDLFRHPESWDAIKRMLRFRLIDLESGEDMRLTLASASLRPEPIPATMKVILIGDPEIYHALIQLDPEFAELFAVRADFDGDLPRNAEIERLYAQFAGDSARAARGPALTADAVAALIEEGSRWAEDQNRVTARLRRVRDLVLETCFMAKRADAQLADRSHVAQAIAARERRLGMAPDKLYDLIQQKTIMIDTTGSVVGQVNGLTVLAVADYEFGAPARITARTSPGAAGIVNLERETLMSGPAHSKGILILNGYLSGKFAADFPLSLSGSICFEQVYGEIEGDSASSAELYALLSSLSGVPIRQSLAVTGSVNQRGEIQAVGGVTAKIEGFFRICQQRGLSGDEGVLIPRANVRHLMLREDVVEAVRAGKFHIYAVSTIDEGIELLTGRAAGTLGATGETLEATSAEPDETISELVRKRLQLFAERVRSFSAVAAPAVTAPIASR